MKNDGLNLEDSQEYVDAAMTSQTSAAVELSPNANSGKRDIILAHKIVVEKKI